MEAEVRNEASPAMLSSSAHGFSFLLRMMEEEKEEQFG